MPRRRGWRPPPSEDRPARSLWPLDLCGGAEVHRYETTRSRPVSLRTRSARPNGRRESDGLDPRTRRSVSTIGGGAGLGCVGGHTLPAANRPRRLSLPIAFRKRPNWIKLERFAMHRGVREARCASIDDGRLPCLYFCRRYLSFPPRSTRLMPLRPEP